MKKIENVREIWGESYFIHQLTYKTFRNKVHEVRLIIASKQGNPSVEFNEHWDRIKHLASRQDFYPIPIHRDKGRGAGVLLIKKSSIHDIDKRLLAIHESMSSEYWVLQGDINSFMISAEVKALADEVNTVAKSIYTMKSGLDWTLSDFFFSECLTVGKFLDYKNRLETLKDMAMHEEKIKNATYRAIESVYKEYAY